MELHSPQIAVQRFCIAQVIAWASMRVPKIMKRHAQ
jgi:hypothetical protein